MSRMPAGAGDNGQPPHTTRVTDSPAAPEPAVTADPARTPSRRQPQPGPAPAVARGAAGTVMPVAARRWCKARNAAVTAVSCAAGGSAGYALGGPVLAVAGAAAVILAGVVVAILISAMLGRRDSRSPFERLMLVLCVITGRRPKDYLPPVPREPAASGEPAVPAVMVVRVTGDGQATYSRTPGSR
jgi:hypothetical protein